ncbi:MAG TPA: ABC transporter ATP-binding protein [Candidatus Polarisedimenticolaceae bacterium]|nr:ABC transporter ATP-binding protein [Candidatus Polarisedimenticolaceae bacterium]
MIELRRLFGYMRPYLGRLLAASLLLLLAGVLMSAVVWTLKPLANEVFRIGGGPPSSAAAHAGRFDILDEVKKLVPTEAIVAWAKDRAYVEVPLLLVAIFFLRSVALYFGQYLVLKAGTSVVRDVRADLHDAITRQSLRFFQAHPTGTILSRILADVARLQKVSTDVLADFIRVGVAMPLFLAGALLHDWKLTLVAMVGLPLLAWPMVKLSRRLRRASTRSQEKQAETASLLAETIAGAKVVQGFAMERFEIGRFRAALDRMLAADLRAARAIALAPAVMELFGAAAGALLFSYAGRQVAKGRIDGGDVMVIVVSLGYFFMGLRRMNAINSEAQQAIAAAGRVFAMMDRERDVRDAPDARPLPPFTGEIRFERVDFAYDGAKVLDGVDASFRRGETIALVGHSGSGKTTLANLIPRFYDPTAGRVLIDGHALTAVTLESLRGQIGLVTQETVLFDDTVRNNIAYGRADVGLDAVVAAAKAAHAHEFIEELPQGYETVLGERGARLSVGQRQRVTIARALLKDPPILILDEATSALDSESEKLVQEALEVLMRNRTSVVIAHRLATVRRATRILVMDRGRIVEIGTHRELIERDGIYARLHALQMHDAPA